MAEKNASKGGKADGGPGTPTAAAPVKHESFSAKRARSKIQQAIDQANADHKKELFRRRLDIARQGLKHYQNHELAKSVKHFNAYLGILEKWKDVPEGGLHPSLFDLKRDVAELMLISGVYWDLVKLYDRTRSPKAFAQLRHYLGKYVIFGKGTPVQPLATETLRKYLRAGSPVHREEFRNAYKALGGSNCFVVTSLVDCTEAQTLSTLRGFRDEVLVTSVPGRVFVGWYYRNGPWLAARVDGLPPFLRRGMGKLIDATAWAVTAIRSRSARD